MKVTLIDTNKAGENIINQASSICYDSDPNKNRISALQKLGHLSCFRFAYATFKVEGISRVCSHQLVRHKHIDYLQRSQRYCNEENTKFVLPNSICSDQAIYEVYDSAITHSEKAYKELIKLGISKEDARFVLPQATETELYVTGSLQAWLNFLRLRLSPEAQWEIREVAEKIQVLLKEEFPSVDFEVE